MKQIKRVWKHSHENTYELEVDFYGRVIGSKPKDPPYRYVVSYEYEGNLYTQEVMASDELDAVKQFLQEE